MKQYLILSIILSCPTFVFSQNITADNISKTSLNISSSSFDRGDIVVQDNFGNLKKTTKSIHDFATKEEMKSLIKSNEDLKKEINQQRLINANLRQELSRLRTAVQNLERKVK